MKYADDTFIFSDKIIELWYLVDRVGEWKFQNEKELEEEYCVCKICI